MVMHKQMVLFVCGGRVQVNTWTGTGKSVCALPLKPYSMSLFCRIFLAAETGRSSGACKSIAEPQVIKKVMVLLLAVKTTSHKGIWL